MPIFTCPKCTSTLQVPEQAEDGTILACPQCQQRLIIPAFKAPPPPVGAFQVGRTARVGPVMGADGVERPRETLLHFVPALSDEPTRLSVPKPLFFGLIGALGCLIAAMLFEYPTYVMTPATVEKVVKQPPKPPEILKVDVVFVLDTTGSMQDQIEGVKKSIERFVNSLKKEKIDPMVGLVDFKDRVEDPPETREPKALMFDGKNFTADPKRFEEAMRGVRADGGGDAPESGFDALDYASKLDFRKDAAKVLILITDAPPRIPDKDNKDSVEVADKLRNRKVQQLHLVIRDNPDAYIEIQRLLALDEKEAKLDREMGGRDKLPKDKDGRPIVDKKAGKTYQLNDLGGGREGLERILEGTAHEIAEEAKAPSRVGALAGEGEYEASDAGMLVVSVGFWTAGLALGLTLALIVASQLYLRRRVGVGTMFKGSLSLFAGFLGGLSAQGLVLLFTWNSSEATQTNVMDLVAKVVGWTLMGSLVGLALAFFVPNLTFGKGLLGGGLGGLSGALLYVICTAVVGELMGRWLGALALGFCVGIMVAMVETVFRRWWLEVRFPTGEIRTVTLGAARVSVGSDPLRATIVLPDGPSISYRFYVDRGKVFCEDRHGIFKMEAGETQEVGEASIMVCSPEFNSQLGMLLELSSGKAIPLSSGLPLTADDLPGLTTASPDGTVALVSPHADEPESLWLRNRSKQQWHVPTGPDQSQAVEPGQSIPLMAGMTIQFGEVQGRLYRPRVYDRSVLAAAKRPPRARPQAKAGARRDGPAPRKIEESVMEREES